MAISVCGVFNISSILATRNEFETITTKAYFSLHEVLRL